jgi:uncharacterized protein YkwD
MAISFQCPCGAKLHAPEDRAGRKAPCPRCGKVLVVPSRPAPAEPPRPVRSLPGPRTADVAPKRTTPTPAARAPQSFRAVLVLLGVLAAFLFAGVVGLGVAGLVGASRPTPQLAQGKTESSPAPRSETARATQPEPNLTQPEKQSEKQPEKQPDPEKRPDPTPDPTPDPPKPPDYAALALERLNHFRTLVGTPPVELDPLLSRDCEAHARYLAQNASHFSDPSFRITDELPELPGFSEDGRRAARNSLSSIAREDPVSVVDGDMATLFIRQALLDPEVHRFGWGVAPLPPKRWLVTLDVQRGLGTNRTITYPIEDQKGVPTSYSVDDVPNPLPQGAPHVVGFPVTVTFPPQVTLLKATGYLTAAGKDVPVWLLTPEEQGPNKKYRGNTICVVPREPLRRNTAYTASVSVEADGVAWSTTWTFSTGDGTPAVGNANTALDRLNAYRKIVGSSPVALDPILSGRCQKHADYLARHADLASTQGLGGRGENPDLAGYTEEGSTASLTAAMSWGEEARLAVDSFMASLHHRPWLLEPEVRRVGLGQAKAKQVGPIVVFDGASARDDGQVLVYPIDKQKDVGLSYAAREKPDPIPESTDKKAGFPITVTFPHAALVKKANAKLTDGQGDDVPCWLSTPEQSVAFGLQRNMVGLIAKQPLEPDATYTVTVTANVDGGDWKRTWSFTTKAK